MEYNSKEMDNDMIRVYVDVKEKLEMFEKECIGQVPALGILVTEILKDALDDAISYRKLKIKVEEAGQ